ncbi:MerR family transcriptional regulator [Paracoccus sp. JM45]|uniref:MerR family transcriptional regulator n=1 Tax=Paracoccus sp. JM45 TaxID=2283626 RepID=UPI000E6BE398|nr:MerR family transcriptional regulator [Paracoccus sp. JM45]RJE79507.1 MerR family transcriptional regulator [Paracoccus sp. JM45]
MAKSAEAFRSIGEVAKLIGVAPHVLRYWETQFTLLRPMKRGDGRRYYRPADVALIAGLCELLRDQGLTIRGARKILAEDKGASVRHLGNERLSRDNAGASGTTDPLPPLPRTDWLLQLHDLGRRLRHLGPRDPRWQAARPVAIRLGRLLNAVL